MAHEASLDHARWLMEQWVAALATAIESMTEERPQVEFAPAEARTAAPGGGPNTFTVDRTAQQIFDDQNPPGTPTGNNVFTAVNQLRVALEVNDTAGMQNAETALTQAGDYLNQQLGFYGASQNRVAVATNLSQTTDVNLQAALAGKQDADMAQAILDLTQAKTQEQATLTARAQMRKTSLFDFLA
jgi:flagellin-like hook-associated protein FlgL